MDKKTEHISLKPPVVAVLGHVDHGKTTLLDYLRKSRIASSEAGGITQHIGAYQVDVEGKKVTFIDTPGHEAFINLRSRGANTADIALLVIDANESVKPQTVESIKIIQKAGIPMIVAYNKMDLPNANPKKVAQDLLRYNVQTEEHGGKVVSVPISAKTGKGVSDLLQAILLVAELKKISGQATALLEASVIESKKDKFRGITSTILVRNGTLKSGEKIWVDDQEEKIRALFDDRGKVIHEATPGMPVEVLGFEHIPAVGARISQESHVGTDTKQKDKEQEGSVLSIMLKADVQGSLEALINGLPKEISIMRQSIGDITEGDVTEAKASGLVIIGFNIGISGRVRKFAEDEGVRIRTYSVIYKLFEEIVDVVEILKKGPQKEIIGQAKIMQEFSTSDGKVAGSQVTEGRIARGDKIQIVRNGKIIIENIKVQSVRQQKEEVTKAEKGKLCGIILSGNVDFTIGDMIQSYTLYEL
jgi:translation initiation factor IF-2